MTNGTAWFRYQLQASADGLLWGYAQIPAAFHEQFPPEPNYLGTWEPARHVWHVMEYERCLVIPSMQQWLGGTLSAVDSWPDDDAAWHAFTDRDLEALTTAFRAVRQRQIDLLDALEAVDWTVPRTTLWGERPLSCIVTKTFQHTYEHGDTLLRMGLWWEHILAAIAAAT